MWLVAEDSATLEDRDLVRRQACVLALHLQHLIPELKCRNRYTVPSSNIEVSRTPGTEAGSGITETMVQGESTRARTAKLEHMRKSSTH